MATYTFDKIEYGGNTYVVTDSGALQLTGGQVTGPVTFGDTITVDAATIGDLVVSGSGSFANNLSVNTINGVTVGSSPKFTDTNTEVSTLTLTSGSTAGTSLTSGGKFTLTAGSKTVSFTMPTIPSDTKNTAGSTNSTSKLFLIGATEQSANPQTYSNSNLYYNKGLHSEVTDSNNIKTWFHQGEVTTGLYRTKNDAGVYLQLCSGTSNEEIRIGLSNSSSYKSVIKVSGTYASPTLTLTNLVSPVNDNDAATKIYVDNKIGGSGTSGCLAKFNGTSSITNGPQLGSGTTTYLRNDGSWATPTETDPTVPSWAKEANKPSYSANEISGLLDFFYPVGSYYETSDTTFDPNVTWGGTWELEAAGQVHVSAGTGYTVAGALTNTTDGGSKDAIIPSHNHTATGAAVAKHSATACSRTTNVGLDNNHNVSVTNSRTTTESGGGSHSHAPSTTTRSFLTATTSGISINRSNIKAGTGTQYDNVLRVGSASAYNGSTESVSIAHSHYFTPSVSVSVKGHNITQPAFSTPELTHTVTQPTISTEGVSVTNKNMQPYIIVNRWHRTA